MLVIAVAVIALLNQPIEHERAASKEVVIDMPSHNGVDLSLYSCPVNSPPTAEESLRCPLGNDDY